MIESLLHPSPSKHSDVVDTITAHRTRGRNGQTEEPPGCSAARRVGRCVLHVLGWAKPSLPCSIVRTEPIYLSSASAGTRAGTRIDEVERWSTPPDGADHLCARRSQTDCGCNTRNVDAAVDLIAASKTTSRAKASAMCANAVSARSPFNESGGWSWLVAVHFAGAKSTTSRVAADVLSARMLTRTHSTTLLNLGLSFVARVRAVASSNVKPVRSESAVRRPKRFT